MSKGQENGNKQVTKEQVVAEVLVQTPAEATIAVSQVKELIAQAIAEERKNNKPVETPKEIVKEAVAQSTPNNDDIPGLENFEFKDRVYVTMGTKAVSEGILNKHKDKSPLQYYNPTMKKLLTMRYATNQSSFFEENQTGSVLIGYINLKDGFLRVPKENVTLQKFLAIHPHNGTRFQELDPAKENQKIIDTEDLLFEAQALARKLTLLEQEAVARQLCVNFREDWDSSTIKLEVRFKAKENPKNFIKVASDETLKVKGIIKTALHREYIAYRNFAYYDENGGLIVNVNRNEDELDVMVDYLSTNKGQQLLEFLKQAVA